MGFWTKGYLNIFLGVSLMGSFLQLKAQSDAVSIRCVAVDSAGDVTLTWVLPPAANMVSDGCNSFTLQGSSTNVVGSYVPVVTVHNITNTDTTIYHTNPSLPSSPNIGTVYFYSTSNNSNPPSYNSNIVSTIYLTVANTGGIALLNWNAISNPLPQGSSTWYQIWREYNYVWSLIDSTQSFTYRDTINYCTPTFLNYQIRVSDSTICISTSNVATSASKFSSAYGLPQIIMDTVSVTSANTVDITWAKSPKRNDTAYIIYEVVPGNNIPIDTVWGINNTRLLNYTSPGNPADSSLIFSVAALDSCGKAGAISNPQNTLFLKVKANTCQQTNTLTWNAYEYLAGNYKDGGGYGIGGYKVFYSVNSGPFQLLASLSKNARRYIDSNLHTRELRCYYIQVYDSAHIDTTASSNIVCDSITPPPAPKNNYLRTATVLLNTSFIQIVGYIDSSSGAAYYEFQRSDSSSGFTTIYTMNAPLHTDSISYIDNAVTPTLRSYFYRITTLDSCDKPIDSTNLGQTILLNALGQPNGTNDLSWNDYGSWYDNPSYYLIYRSEDGVNYTLVSPVSYTGAGQNVYVDNISNITTGEGTFYYYIKAVENNAPGLYPFTDTSLSNIAMAYQDPIVFIPNAFCPNGKNNVFIPVGVFIDVTGYDFSIYDRWGQRIFDSNEPSVGWNGKDGGKVVEQGVYCYLLTYTSSKGEYFQRKGTVTLLK